MPDWPEFSWIQFEVDNSLDALKKLHEINQQAFNAICNDLESKISKLRIENNNLSGQELEQYEQHIYGLEERILLELNTVQNSSTIVYAFAIFENKLKLISDKIQQDFKFALPTTKSNSYTSEYWKILKNFSTAQINSMEKYFTPIKTQMVLRNIIIHQNSVATFDQHKTIRKVNGLKFNEFKNEYYLINVEYSFINELILKVETFFRALLEVIRYETNQRLRNVI